MRDQRSVVSVELYPRIITSVKWIESDSDKKTQSDLFGDLTNDYEFMDRLNEHKIAIDQLRFSMDAIYRHLEGRYPTKSVENLRRSVKKKR